MKKAFTGSSISFATPFRVVCMCFVSACIHAWVFALCCIHKFVLDLAILQNEQSRRLRRRHCCVKDCASGAALATSRLHCGKAHSFELLP